jgi:hypothetical protein
MMQQSQGDANHSPSAASGGLEDVLLIAANDMPQPNEEIVPGERIGDGRAAQLPEDLVVASRQSVATFWPPGDASESGQPTITDRLGEVILLYALENPGSPDLPSGGKSRGLEYVSGRMIKAEIVGQNEEEEDEVDVDDGAEIKILPTNPQPEHDADHMSDVEIKTLDASTWMCSKA